MTDFDVDVHELNSLAVELVGHSIESRRAASAVVRATAFRVVGTAQVLAPVDTGATRSSIHATVPAGGPLAGFSLEAEIGPTTEYAYWLEFGTTRMAPHAFMGPALDRHTPEFVQAIAEIPDLLDE